MAKKRISKEDIAPSGVFDNVTQGAKEAKAEIILLTEAVKILKKTAENIKKDVGATGGGSTQGMKDFDELAKKANLTAEAKLNVDKRILEQKAKLQLANADQNKAIKTEIQATQKLTKTQQSSLGTLQKLEISNRKLRAERARLNLDTKKGQLRLKEINAEIDKNNNKIKASGDTMKKQRMNVGNYNGAINKLRGSLAKLGLSFGVFSILKGAFNVIKDFQQASANLRSVLGPDALPKDVKALTEQAKELGATTRFTASQVSGLQLELAKLGFDPRQIQQMTEATSELAEATGTDLARSAEVVGATLRGFGLEANETQRVVDVMAKSFTSSSLDMEKFATAMASVAPVAKVAGVNIEETSALIGTLTDRGLDASTAGTGLRNIFLDLTKNGLTYDEAMKKINESTDKSATALDLFGKRGATIGVILAENQDGVSKLTESIKDNENAAKDMAETQRKTLAGSLDLLKSAWEGQILKMDEAGGVGEKLRKTIGFIADNLEEIIRWVGIATQTFIAFKVALLALKLNERYKEFTNFNKGIKDTTKATEKATPSVKAFGKALKSIGFALAISALIEFAKAFYDVASGAQRARFETEMFNKSNEKGAEIAEGLIKRTRDKLELEKQNLQMLRANREITQEELEARIKAETAKADATIQNGIKISRSAKNASLARLKIEEDLLASQEKSFSHAKEFFSVSKEQTTQLELQKNKVAKLRAEIAGQGTAITILKDESKLYLNELVGIDQGLAEINSQNKEAEEQSKKNKKAKEEETKVIKFHSEAIKEEEKNISEGADFVVQRLTEVNDLEDQRKINIAEIGVLNAQLGGDEKEIIEARIKLIEVELAIKTSLMRKGTVERIKLEKEAELKIRELRESSNKKNNELLKQSIDFATDYFTQQIDKRIEKINEEIEAHKNRADELKELAQNGNIQAQESIAEEKALQREAEREKAEQEKRKQQILMVTAFIQSYLSNIEGGDDSGTAFTKAITNQAFLDQIVQNIGSFFVGTEDTGRVGNGLDSNGGRLAVLHNNERVMTAKQNAKIGNVTNEEVARVMENRRLGKLIEGSKSSVGFENEMLMNQLFDVSSKLNEVNKSIQNKEETKIELGAITQSAMNIVETKTKGKIRTVNTFKVK